jgi:general secretion pathway protein D
VTSKYIVEWSQKLDVPEAAGDAETAFSYHPKYTRASDLVESIKRLYGVTSTPSTPSTTTPATPSPDTRSTAPRTATTRSAALAGGHVLGISGLKMSADDGKNMIIIISSASTYKTILSLLKGLDTPPRQVLIEATIAELTLTDELKYGLEWYLANTYKGDAYTLSTLGALGVQPLGLSLKFLSDTAKVRGLVSALATANKANILSTPRLTVLDNKEATIQVGEDVPTITSQTTSTEATVVTSTVQYRTTGVLMRVKPTINSEGLLTLDISQEVSQAGAPGAGDSPIILTRNIKTTVVVAHGETLALGGLMKENVSVSESKVPLLGDIPLIGNLFKYTVRTKDKTELLVLVTPTILVSTDDATKITDELKKELKWIK